MDARVSTHAYPDGQIDGEILIYVPRGMTSKEVGSELEHAFETQPKGLARRFWFSLGVRASIKEEEEVYRRFKGMNEVALYYRKVTTPALVDNFLSLYSFRVVEGKRHPPLVSNVEEKYRRKVEIVFLRIHWNPDGSKPKR